MRKVADLGLDRLQNGDTADSGSSLSPPKTSAVELVTYISTSIPSDVIGA